jgi:hypothetical protein
MVDVARAVDASAPVEISQVEVSGPAHGSVGADVPATAWASRIWSTIVDVFQASRSRPLPALLDAAVVAAVARLLWSRPSTVAATVAAYLVAALTIGLYRPRASVECQGVTWYARAVTAPALVTGLLLWSLPITHTDAAMSATIAGAIASALILLRVVLWNVLAVARRRGHCLRPALVIGTTSGIARLQHRLATFPEAGLRFGGGYDLSSREGGGGVKRGPSDLDLAVRAAKHVIVVADDLERETVRQVVTHCWWERRSVTVVLPVSSVFLPYRLAWPAPRPRGVPGGGRA